MFLFVAWLSTDLLWTDQQRCSLGWPACRHSQKSYSMRHERVWILLQYSKSCLSILMMKFLCMCHERSILLAHVHVGTCMLCNYTPRNEVRGVYWNHHVRPSVRPSVCLSVPLSVRPSVRPHLGFPAHNCFPFTPIIMKLHMQTPHESRMCPIDFEVKRSRSQCMNYWKWFSGA